MRTRAVLGSIFASMAVLVVGWQAGGTMLADQAGSTTTAAPQLGASTGGTPTTTTAPPSDATTGSADGTYTGASVNTRFGSVQVAVTISGGTITDVTALHLTDTDRRSVQISNRAAPILQQEILASQSASVSNVGGATYTSHAYLESVQSALDQGGL